MENGHIKLKVTEVTKNYGEKCILDHVTFDVYDGEFLSVLGPSGCGKTTLLRILIGLLEADSGAIVKDGTEITHATASARGMGIVFQNYALFENMTVLGGIRFKNKKGYQKASAHFGAGDAEEDGTGGTRGQTAA